MKSARSLLLLYIAYLARIEDGGNLHYQHENLCHQFAADMYYGGINSEFVDKIIEELTNILTKPESKKALK